MSEEGMANPDGKSRIRYVAAQNLVEDSFADGATGFVIGRNVVKLDLYRVIGFDQEKKQEVRTISHRIVLPMTAIAELKSLLGQIDVAIEKAAEAAQSAASAEPTAKKAGKQQ